MTIYVDADACPVKDEALKVADRHGIEIVYVANAWMRLPDHPLVRRVVVTEGPDAADDWIAEHIGPGDICITADIPLAKRSLENGARAISNVGKAFDEASIGMAMAMRDLSRHLRETGESRGFNAAFERKDRARFLETLENTVQAIKRSGR